MKMACMLCPVLTVLLLIGCAHMEKNQMASNMSQAGSQRPQEFEKTVTKTVRSRYLLFLPQGYGQEQKRWPMILFLHGAGERGDDLEKVKVHGPPKVVEKQKDFPFIVVSPQCPDDDWWTEKVDVLIGLLDDIVARYDVDTERIYLTGLSMGGYGTWALAARYPERFAAAVPICGGGSRIMARRLKDLPIWVFHGAKDNTVPLKESQEMVTAIKNQGGDVKLTVYPDAGHDSWTATYDNPELYDWLLEHRRVGKGR